MIFCIRAKKTEIVSQPSAGHGGWWIQREDDGNANDLLYIRNRTGNSSDFPRQAYMDVNNSE